MAGPGLEARELSKLIEIRVSRTISMERQCDTKLGLRGKQGKYYFLITKSPILFKLVSTSLLVEDLALKQNDFQNSLKIRLSRTVSIERQSDDKFGLFG